MSGPSLIISDDRTVRTVTVIRTEGTGGVSKVGTPVNDQVGIWTGDGTIEGTSAVTFDGSTLLVEGEVAINGKITQHELSADPSDPVEGSSVRWQSDGTEHDDFELGEIE